MLCGPEGFRNRFILWERHRSDEPNRLSAVAKYISRECGDMTKTGLLLAFDNIYGFHYRIPSVHTEFIIDKFE